MVAMASKSDSHRYVLSTSVYFIAPDYPPTGIVSATNSLPQAQTDRPNNAISLFKFPGTNTTVPIRCPYSSHCFVVMNLFIRRAKEQ